MNEVLLNQDMNLFPTLAAYSASNALVKAVIGPAGSAKTTWSARDLMRLCLYQKPSSDGVCYLTIAVVRGTYNQLRMNTIVTLKKSIPREALKIYNETGTQTPYGIMKFSHEGLKYEAKLDFIAMDKPNAASDNLGYEPSIILIDEVSELTEEQVMSLIRRVGRGSSFDQTKTTYPVVMMTTNGPSTEHFLYKWALGSIGKLPKGEERDRYEAAAAVVTEYHKRPFFEIYQQPPALLRPKPPSKDWLPNPKAENVWNLPAGYGYYAQMLMGSEASIRAYVEGRFAPITHGKVVFPEFRREFHVVPEGDIDKDTIDLVHLSFDFGRTPVCLIGYMDIDGALVIVDELMRMDMGIDAFYTTVVRPHLRKYYRSVEVGTCYGDPAGRQRPQTSEVSVFGVLQGHGVNIIAPVDTNQFAPRIEAVRQLLTRTSVGRPLLRVSSKCEMLIKSLGSNYIYEFKRGSDGEVREVPTKGHVEWVSDLADALQYMALGVIGVAKRPMTRRQHTHGISRGGVV